MPEQYSNKPDSMSGQIFYSFKVAFDGLFHVLLTQRNMRFHISIAIWVLSFAILFDLDPFRKAFLYIIVSFVFSMEILNTCIEALTDLLSPEYNEKAKIAKDTAAAAVLSVAIGSVISAGYLLIPPFFKNVFDPQWMEVHTKELLAVGTVVMSVLIYWGIRSLNVLPRSLLLICGAASAGAISLLGRLGNDWVSFSALILFSVLLFNAMGRETKGLLFSFIGHIIGILAYVFFVVIT